MEMLLIGETISLIFGLSIGNTIIAAKEGLNFELSKYFQGEDGEHYVPQASNLIVKTHLEEIVSSWKHSLRPVHFIKATSL
jgi:hypothetical protein